MGLNRRTRPNVWTFVTDLGDSGVTIPLAGLTLLFLLMAREWQSARAWVVMVVGCAVVIGGLKLLFGACGQRLALHEIISPSGHTAMSVAIYLSFALLFSRGVSQRLARPVFFGGVLLVVSIGVSRTVLHAHDLAEVLVGFMVGLFAHAYFRCRLFEGRLATRPLVAMVISALVLIAALHGSRWPIEPWLYHIEERLRLMLPWCR
jgi:membrane-associated phospholipid phosphatase